MSEIPRSPRPTPQEKLKQAALELRFRHICPVCDKKLPSVSPFLCPHCQCILRFKEWRLARSITLKLYGETRSFSYATDAYRFMYDAIKLTMEEYVKAIRPPKPAEHAICDTVMELAFRRFTDSALSRLKEWGVQESMDVGQITWILIRAGLFAWDVNPEQSLAAFRGIYAVGDDTWQTMWLTPNPKRGKCRQCGYDLRATPTLICPECGTNHF